MSFDSHLFQEFARLVYASRPPPRPKSGKKEENHRCSLFFLGIVGQNLDFRDPDTCPVISTKRELMKPIPDPFRRKSSKCVYVFSPSIFNVSKNIPPTSVSEDPGPLQNERSQISDWVAPIASSPNPFPTHFVPKVRFFHLYSIAPRIPPGWGYFRRIVV